MIKTFVFPRRPSSTSRHQNHVT